MADTTVTVGDTETGEEFIPTMNLDDFLKSDDVRKRLEERIRKYQPDMTDEQVAKMRDKVLGATERLGATGIIQDTEALVKGSLTLAHKLNSAKTRVSGGPVEWALALTAALAIAEDYLEKSMGDSIDGYREMKASLYTNAKRLAVEFDAAQAPSYKQTKRDVQALIEQLEKGDGE